MRESRGLLILLAGVVLAAGLVWFFTRPKPPAPSEAALAPADPVPFYFAEVPFRSPDLEVSDVAVGGSLASSYSSWVVIAICAEPEGCVGEMVAEVKYRSEDGKGVIRLSGIADVPVGGKLRFDGLQNGYHPVEQIDQVAIEVTSREVPDFSPEAVEF